MRSSKLAHSGAKDKTSCEAERMSSQQSYE